VRRESLRETPIPSYAHEDWERDFPGVAAGVTAAGPGLDFGHVAGEAHGRRESRFATLGRKLGFPAVRFLDQVHGTDVVVVSAGGLAGACLAGRADGFLTRAPDTLLALTVADCVPIFLLEPAHRIMALLHAGWRGIASGILETGLAAMATRGAAVGSIHCHLGPAICGLCYEVGPEVLAALGRPGDGAGRVDLRAELARRARAAGIAPSRLTFSTWCTRCGEGRFESHRARGARARRVAAYLGWAGQPVANAPPVA